MTRRRKVPGAPTWRDEGPGASMTIEGVRLSYTWTGPKGAAGYVPQVHIGAPERAHVDFPILGLDLYTQTVYT